MAAGSYIIRGGLEGRERLRLLARVMRPASLDLFARAGVDGGMRCIDVGCGGGDASIELARIVAPTGSVVGLDVDPIKIGLARAEAAGIGNLSFVQADLETGLADLAPADLVYSRFVLSHLRSPEVALARLPAQVLPGGLLVLEDIQISAHLVDPPSAAHDAYVDLYRRAAQARGADPDLGPRLPALLRAAGFSDVQVQVVQPAGLQGEMKQVSRLTMESIADAVLQAGLADHGRIDGIVAELARMADDPAVLMSIARVVQAWGRKPLA
ncbi:methyltransferase domain-containing protein [Geminicoccus roseus]|uniref:methyltransferase domain-containing protein n=1 Tax=Geminicoccus roseus TaxID=404900 RepID=UPI00042660E4|nr:methyltransferase domain-containing protein [Geminicoccus roseus]